MDFGSYTNKVIEHFMTPRNVGNMVDPDGIGEFGNMKCGDSLTTYIKVEDGKIKEIKYLVFGCPAAIATSSMVSVMAKGLSLEDAMKISDDDITDALDGLPDIKKHCSVLGASALHNAIEDYYKNKK